jgi:hypothetical protein
MKGIQKIKKYSPKKSVISKYSLQANGKDKDEASIATMILSLDI